MYSSKQAQYSILNGASVTKLCGMINVDVICQFWR